MSWGSSKNEGQIKNHQRAVEILSTEINPMFVALFLWNSCAYVWFFQTKYDV